MSSQTGEEPQWALMVTPPTASRDPATSRPAPDATPPVPATIPHPVGSVRPARLWGLLRLFGRYDVRCGKGVHSARSPVVLGVRGFHNSSDYVLALLINKSYFHLRSLAVLHAQGHCSIDEWLQVIDSHACLAPPHYAGSTTTGNFAQNPVVPK